MFDSIKNSAVSVWQAEKTGRVKEKEELCGIQIDWLVNSSVVKRREIRNSRRQHGEKDFQVLLQQ